jgi:hypothetical protein
MVTIMHNAVDNGSNDNCGVDTIVLDQTDFTCDDIGDVVVVQTVTDVNGNTSTCTATVTVEDNLLPVCLAMDITVELGPDGTVMIDSNAVDAGSFDNCGIAMIDVEPDLFDCNSPDIVVVVQTVTDVNGNTSFCLANVTVLGGDAPEAVCMDITVSLDENGMATITGADVDGGSSSLCGDLELSVSPDTFDCNDVGDNVVVLTVTDVTGATATCTATVTVVDDLAPICMTQDITVMLDANGNATILNDAVDNGSSDNCGIESITLSQTNFNCDDVGDVIVVQTVTDVNGNSSTCTAVVTVEDNIFPDCMTQNITVEVDGNGNATITADQVDAGSNDNCGPVTLSVVPSMFTCDHLGDNEVVLTVTDDSGNSATCTAIVTVEDPGILQALCQNLTVFLDGNGMVVVDPEDVDNGSGGGCFAGMLTFELDQTTFNCTDLGVNTVTLTVTDELGMTATCTATITVIDNLPPTLNCPGNTMLDCDDPIDIMDLSPYGVATADDNCPPVMIEETIEDDRNECGQGTITRTFLATDPSGNTAQCVQIITVADMDPFDEEDITWPPGVVNIAQCNSTDPGPGNQPVIDSGTCTNISVDYEDVVEMTVDDDPGTPCLEITRMWTVIDSCQLETGTQNGIFEFTQMIFYNDSVGPVFTPLADVTVNADTTTCTAFVSLVTTATDCSMTTAVTNDYNAGGGDASDDFPIGVTVVTFTSTDPCGNVSTMDVQVTVLDADPPAIGCDKIIRFLDEELELTVHAEEFITFTPGSCSGIDDYLFSYDSDDPFDSLQTFGCSQVGVEPVFIHTFDLAGNPIDTCRGDLDLRDTADFCGDGLTLSGHIFGEWADMIGDVAVQINEPSMQTVYTNQQGRYYYTDLQPGGSYVIEPYRNVEPKRGVSTLDLVSIQKHLLGFRPLGTPYQLIAADANRSGGVSATDLLEIRRLLLEIIPEFSQNTSWRFVEAGYGFPDPQNPWAAPFPESMEFDQLSEHISQADFIGIKIGDVNSSVFNLHPGDIQVRSSDAVSLRIEDRNVTAGEIIEVPVTVSNYTDLSGYQFTLQCDPVYAQFRGVTLPKGSFLSSEWFGTTRLNEGLITTLWHEPASRSLTDGEILFSVQVEVRRNGQLSAILGLADSALAPEAYRGDEARIVPVYLGEGAAASRPEFAVYQNIPNPFADGTLIPVQLPERAEVALEVYTADGALVLRKTEQIDAGYHEFFVNSHELNNGGVYYYIIATDKYRATRKMILLD